MKIEKCHKCGKPMKVVLTKHEGTESEAYRCTPCKITIYTEEQALMLGRKLQQKFMKEKYTKKPVKIGNSYGVIFPRDLVKVFNLDSAKTTLDFKMDKSKSKIEITVL